MGRNDFFEFANYAELNKAFLKTDRGLGGFFNRDIDITNKQTVGVNSTFESPETKQLGLDWQDHVKVDSALFRPADVAVSRANPAKAALSLGWKATMGPADVARAMAVHEQQEILQK